MSTEAERTRLLDGEGLNVFRLPASAVPFDCMTDVPGGVLVPTAVRGAAEASYDEVVEALSPLTGTASLALMTKGRAAELALVESLALGPSPVVVTNGLFSTTRTALTRAGATIETAPIAAPGMADIDLDWLRDRLAGGGVHAIYLEVANNALHGWSLSEANLAAVREQCDLVGATLLLDGCRAISNAIALGATDAVGHARRMLSLAHAFTVSCAKEFLVPVGAVVGSSDVELVGRANQIAFRSGTTLGLPEPGPPRADLRDGARYVLRDTTLFAQRRALVHDLASRLKARGVTIVEPLAAHAVYVPLDPSLRATEDMAAMFGILAHIYTVSGVRGQIMSSASGAALRLSIKLQSSCTNRERDAIADGLAVAFTRIAERPRLTVRGGQASTHPYFRRLECVA